MLKLLAGNSHTSLTDNFNHLANIITVMKQPIKSVAPLAVPANSGFYIIVFFLDFPVICEDFHDPF